MKTLKSVLLLLAAWGAITSPSFATYYVNSVTTPRPSLVDGPNLFTYVRNNPWTSWDPDGLQAAEGDADAEPPSEKEVEDDRLAEAFADRAAFAAKNNPDPQDTLEQALTKQFLASRSKEPILTAPGQMPAEAKAPPEGGAKLDKELSEAKAAANSTPPQTPPSPNGAAAPDDPNAAAQAPAKAVSDDDAAVSTNGAKTTGTDTVSVATTQGGATGPAAVGNGGSTALTTNRLTTEGEIFIRYESTHPAFSRVTSSGGVTPGTFAAPASDGLIPLGERVPTYNLPSPNIPRPNAIQLMPPAGTPIIGPRPVSGGTGNEVIFPFGF